MNIANHTTPEAELAAALFDADTERLLELGQYQEAAAAILAAMPPGWCGHDAAAIRLLMDSETRDRTALLDAEIARLRAALEKIEAKPWSPGADCGVGDCVDIARAALDGWTLVRRDDLRRWNVSHGNTCYATTLGPDARCTCGLSAALAVVLVIVEKP